VIGSWWVLLLACGGGDAEDAYRAGRFAAARALYQAALNERRGAPGPLLHNLGNCSYRLGDLAGAAWYYRRALVHLPDDPDTRFNLDLVEARLGRPESPPMSRTERVAAFVADRSTLVLLAWVGGLQTIGLVGVVLCRRRGTRLVMALLALTGLAGLPVCVRAAAAEATALGVVLPRRIVLRTEPHAAMSATVSLAAGQLVRVHESSDRWARVTHSTGTGWTERAGIGVVD
jgi:hypothetical protein